MQSWAETHRAAGQDQKAVRGGSGRISAAADNEATHAGCMLLTHVYYLHPLQCNTVSKPFVIKCRRGLPVAAATASGALPAC